jgi:hypothetical protein
LHHVEQAIIFGGSWRSRTSAFDAQRCASMLVQAQDLRVTKQLLSSLYRRAM